MRDEDALALVAQAPRTLGELVAAVPAAARVLERVGLDYCCRGRRTLAEACAAAGLDAHAVAAEIAALPPCREAEWASLPLPALADHIVTTHHRYLHEELPLLDALAAKVEDAHGRRHAELARVRALIAELRADLEPHLQKEERVLFPAIRALVDEGRRDFPFGSVANPIHVMVAEHDRAGELLAALREVTGGYTAPGDACASYRSLYARLAILELDTHEHIHKENHVLFPGALRAWDDQEVADDE
jgi:regulator of cell morphogenesis and NO signaling